MSELSYTPGPWIVKDDDAYDHIFSQAKPHRRIAAVYGGIKGSNEFDLINQSNARLIAAAPEMFEALKRIRTELMELYSPYAYRVNFKYIDEAIEKATNG